MPVLSSLSGHEVNDIAQAAVGSRRAFGQRCAVQGLDAADSLDRVRRKVAGSDDGASVVRRPVDIHAYAERVVIRQDGRIVAEHPRRYGRGATVVTMRPAIEAASCSATRTTFAGSTTPALTISTNCPVRAS